MCVSRADLPAGQCVAHLCALIDMQLLSNYSVSIGSVFIRVTCSLICPHLCEPTIELQNNQLL